MRYLVTARRSDSDNAKQIRLILCLKLGPDKSHSNAEFIVAAFAQTLAATLFVVPGMQ